MMFDLKDLYRAQTIVAQEHEPDGGASGFFHGSRGPLDYADRAQAFCFRGLEE